MEPIKKVPFTKEMKSTHTILIPTMLPIHFKIFGKCPGKLWIPHQNIGQLRTAGD